MIEVFSLAHLPYETDKFVDAWQPEVESRCRLVFSRRNDNKVGRGDRAVSARWWYGFR